jgi:hypothetical protein
MPKVHRGKKPKLYTAAASAWVPPPPGPRRRPHWLWRTRHKMEDDLAAKLELGMDCAKETILYKSFLSIRFHSPLALSGVLLFDETPAHRYTLDRQCPALEYGKYRAFYSLFARLVTRFYIALKPGSSEVPADVVIATGCRFTYFAGQYD